MPLDSRIASATRDLHAHLLQAYATPDWEGPAPGVVDVFGPEPVPIGEAERLFVHLYAMTEEATARNAVTRDPGTGRPRARVDRPALALELRYLVAARASSAVRGNAMLGRAWERLNADPVARSTGASSAETTVMVAHGFSVGEAIALFRALDQPLQPAFGCRIRVNA